MIGRRANEKFTPTTKPFLTLGKRGGEMSWIGINPHAEATPASLD
jgi:hypothetical protein